MQFSNSYLNLASCSSNIHITSEPGIQSISKILIYFTFKNVTFCVPPDILLKFGQIIGDQTHSDSHFLREEMGRAGDEGLHCGSSVDRLLTFL